jgi:hypothetical protein
LSPTREYFSYSGELLKYFSSPRVTNFYYYLNAIKGIKKCFCRFYSLWINNENSYEKLLLIVFPRDLQTPEVQFLYGIANHGMEFEKNQDSSSDNTIHNTENGN